MQRGIHFVIIFVLVGVDCLAGCAYTMGCVKGAINVVILFVLVGVECVEGCAYAGGWVAGAVCV